MSKFLEFRSFDKNEPLFINKDAIQGVQLTDYHDYNRPRRTLRQPRGPNFEGSSEGPTIIPNVVAIYIANSVHFVKGSLQDFWKKYDGNEKKSRRSKKTKKGL